MTWIDTALSHLASRTPVALVTLTEVKGSAPRDAGARMLVWANGQAGTIGGGNLEFMIVREARALLLEAEAVPQERDYPLGPILGQCCGGRVTVRIEPLGAAHKPWLKREKLGEEAGKTPLLLFGAGHVGQAIVQAVAPLPFALAWFDTRREYATQAKFVTDPLAIVAAAPEGAFYLILTHNHDLDYELTRAVLARADAGYCGLIGSVSKRARFERQLRADGVPAGQIDSLVCPIGGALAVKDKSPPVIAAVAAAEMLMVREHTRRAMAGATHVE